MITLTVLNNLSAVVWRIDYRGERRNVGRPVRRLLQYKDDEDLGQCGSSRGGEKCSSSGCT